MFKGACAGVSSDVCVCVYVCVVSMFFLLTFFNNVYLCFFFLVCVLKGMTCPCMYLGVCVCCVLCVVCVCL